MRFINYLFIHRTILLSFICILFIENIDGAIHSKTDGTTSDKPVKLNLNGNTGSLFLDRLFQVITVILLLIILIIVIITSISVVWYCCIDRPRRKLSQDTSTFDSVSTTPMKFEAGHETKS